MREHQIVDGIITRCGGYRVGQRVRLKPSVRTRPSYFNCEGNMDYFLSGEVFVIEAFNLHPRDDKRDYVLVQDKNNSAVQYQWCIRIDDIMSAAFDNREVANVWV